MDHFCPLVQPVHNTQRSQTDHRVDEVVTTYETDFGVIKAQVQLNNGPFLPLGSTVASLDFF